MTEQPNDQSQGHPAWQEILDQLPDDLHPLITPKLEEWEKNMQHKLQDVRAPYEPYSKLIENEISPEQVEQALYLASQFSENPEAIVARAIESFGLDFVPKSAIPSTPANADPDEDEFEEYGNLENHPAFKAMMEKVNQAEQILTSRQQQEQEATQAEELDKYLSGLEETEGKFDRLYVSALMANGVDGEEAVKMYKNTISEAVQAALGETQQQNKTVPVVMGGDGGTGTGTPVQPVQMGSLSKGGLNDIVLQFLEQNDTNKT